MVECGHYVAVRCAKCDALHTYQRFCKTAGCEVPGCAQARQRLHVRRLMCVDFDFTKPLYFVALTIRNTSKENVESKDYRKARIAAIQSVLASLKCERWCVAHEITVNEKLPASMMYHYHHHLVFQIDYEDDRDLHGQLHTLWTNAVLDVGQDAFVNYEHGVDIQSLSCENHEALCGYLCKYLAKGANELYHPKGMQAFQRCRGFLVDREFDYDVISYAIQEASKVVEWKNVVTVANKYGRGVDDEIRTYHFDGKGARELKFPNVLARGTVQFLANKAKVVMKAERNLTINVDGHRKYKLDAFGKPIHVMGGGFKMESDYRITKQCVNCKGTFREDRYNTDKMYAVLDSDEYDEYILKCLSNARTCKTWINKRLIKELGIMGTNAYGTQ